MAEHLPNHSESEPHATLWRVVPQRPDSPERILADLAVNKGFAKYRRIHMEPDAYVETYPKVEVVGFPDKLKLLQTTAKHFDFKTLEYMDKGTISEELMSERLLHASTWGHIDSNLIKTKYWINRAEGLLSFRNHVLNNEQRRHAYMAQEGAWDKLMADIEEAQAYASYKRLTLPITENRLKEIVTGMFHNTIRQFSQQE